VSALQHSHRCLGDTDAICVSACQFTTGDLGGRLARALGVRLDIGSPAGSLLAGHGAFDDWLALMAQRESELHAAKVDLRNRLTSALAATRPELGHPQTDVSAFLAAASRSREFGSPRPLAAAPATPSSSSRGKYHHAGPRQQCEALRKAGFAVLDACRNCSRPEYRSGCREVRPPTTNFEFIFRSPQGLSKLRLSPRIWSNRETDSGLWARAVRVSAARVAPRPTSSRSLAGRARFRGPRWRVK
jgi:hypothetical protein